MPRAAKVSSVEASAGVVKGDPPAPGSSQERPGKFDVAIVDFELDASTGEGSPPSSNLLVGRIFYPASASKEPTRPRWMSLRYSHAHARFVALHEEGPGGLLQRVKTAVGAAAFHGALVASDARVPAGAGVAAPPLQQKFPAVVFSHGLGGSRACYSSFAAELASLGFFVVSVEHLDKTAAVARLPGNKGYKYYEPWAGFGVVGDDGTAERSLVRRAELAAAARVARALSDGSGLDGLSLEGGTLPHDFFAGAVDAERVGACGHSFGGAAVVDAAAGGDGPFSSAVALCPWFPALAGGHANRALEDGGGRRSPLLIVGSEEYNTPDERGKLPCDGEMQERALASFSKSKNSGGALFTIVVGSTHFGFTDAPYLPRVERRGEVRPATGGGDEGGGGTATEEKDATSTVRAAAEMTAAFLRSRASKSSPVDEEDRRAVEEAASKVGVGLRGVRVV